MDINGVYFNWKSNDHHTMGFIAEQIGQIVPEIVQYENPDNASNWYIDNKTGKKMLYATGVDYGALTPMLVQAMKGQQDLIVSQNDSINTLFAQDVLINNSVSEIKIENGLLKSKNVELNATVT